MLLLSRRTDLNVACLKQTFLFQKKKSADGNSGAEEGGSKKKDENENQLKRTKSRELRGGIMYYSCHCIKRNGLQHDCRRTGCSGEPTCLALPDPLCAPSQLARARGLADPAALSAHLQNQEGSSSGRAEVSGSTGGNRFIVCELKGIVPGTSADTSEKCCKCPNLVATQVSKSEKGSNSCVCKDNSCKKSPSDVKGGAGSVFKFDENTLNSILKSFEKKELISKGTTGHARELKERESPCTRPGCIHRKPPPPCLWNAPCKADCFETSPNNQAGHNQLRDDGGITTDSKSSKTDRPPLHSLTMKLLNPTGCSSGEDGATGSNGPLSGLPVLLMKLC